MTGKTDNPAATDGADSPAQAGGADPTPATAGVVVIGNEILSGKTEDSNSPYLCRELTFLGVDVRQIVTIPDEAKMIGVVVREFSANYTWVFTSGGIGPTHDDITIPSIADEFGVGMMTHPRLEEGLRKHYAEKLTPDHLLMARIPEGAELIDIPGRFFWQVRFRNIFIMPGIPQLFRHRFEALKPQLKCGRIFLREFFLDTDEGIIAGTLREVDENHPGVLIGSYPDFFRSDFTVKITLESRDEKALEKARAELKTRLENQTITIVRES